MVSRVSGFEQANRELNRQLKAIANPMTERFVTEFVVQIKARSAALTPVMTSNLINSSYHRVYATTTGYAGEMGYGASYATFVHEAPGTLLKTATFRRKSEPGWGRFWDPNAEPGFLQKGVDQTVQEDLGTLIEKAFNI